MRLVGDPAQPRLLTVRTGVDQTERLTAWSLRRVEELPVQDLCGFIFKSKSPSSGMERVKVHRDGGVAATGVGIFARIFRERFPLRKYDQPYLKEQYYLHPHPLELKLRNHV
jgi:uncharacterized protein YbbK (DUF523 family)